MRDTGVALDGGRDLHLVLRHRESGFRRCSGVCFFLFQVCQDLRNHLMVSNEGNDAEGPSTIAFQRIDKMDALDEAGPIFSESGALVW